MKRFFLIVVAIVGLVSCSTSSETIKALQDAANSEAAASAKYAQFARLAADDSLANVAALFSAAAYAESTHLKSMIEMLKEFGVHYQPQVGTVVVDSVVSNLYTAKSGEEYEVQSIYPEMAAVARGEGQERVAKFFESLISVENSHAQLYISAIESLQSTGNDSSISAVYITCPDCGYIYTPSDIVENCVVCNAPAQKFRKFIGNVK